MHFRFAAAALAGFAVAASAFAADTAPKPPAGLMQTFPGCSWCEIKGAALSIWSLK